MDSNKKIGVKKIEKEKIDWKSTEIYDTPSDADICEDKMVLRRRK